MPGRRLRSLRSSTLQDRHLWPRPPELALLCRGSLARAQGDATAFNKVYEQYRLAPEVTRQRMYYETMERVLRETDKTVIEAEGVTPYLPLPELRRRSQQTAPAAGGQ